MMEPLRWLVEGSDPELGLQVEGHRLNSLIYPQSLGNFGQSTKISLGLGVWP